MPEKKDEEAMANAIPVDMPDFTILQILTWTSAEIERCRERLETEPSGRIVAFLQGKIPGCKFAIGSIREIFGFTDESFNDFKHPVEMSALTMEQVLGAEIDMNKLKENELWLQFLSVIDSKTEGLKDFLLKEAKKSRELDECQGEYKGMMHYMQVFNSIHDQVDFWKHSLFKKQSDLAGTEDGNDEAPALYPPALPAPEEDYPPAEDYEDSGERLLDDLPDEGEIIDDPSLDMGDDGPDSDVSGNGEPIE